MLKGIKHHASKVMKYENGGAVKNAREYDEDSGNDWGAKNSRERRMMTDLQDMPQETAGQLAKKSAAATASLSVAYASSTRPAS